MRHSVNIGLASLLSFLALAGCEGAVSEAAANPARRGTPESAVAVEVSPLERGPLSRPVSVSGLVRPKQSHALGFKVGGALMTMNVEPGMRVKKGQTLATVDPSEYSASASQAKDGLEKAERDLGRARALVKEGALARASLEDAETAARVAKSSAVAATFNERHTVLIAPTDGVVEARLAEPGEIVSPGRPILSFIGEKRGWVVDVSLSDRDVAAIESGASASVTFDAGGEVRGVVGDISRIGNPRTGTFNAEVILPHTLPITPRSGLVAKVRLPRTEDVRAVVPLSALVDGNGKRAAVYSVDGGVARRHEVVVSFFAGDRVGLASELPGVESVIVRGVKDLVDGSPVAVVDPIAQGSR